MITQLIKSGIKLEPQTVAAMVFDAEQLRKQLLNNAELIFGEVDPRAKAYRTSVLRLMSEHTGYIGRLKETLEIHKNPSQAV
jgi:hypothetical protein